MATLTKEIHEHIVEAGFVSTVAEMGPYDPAAVSDDLRVPEELLEKIKSDDEKPLFVTVEVESGWSQSKRNWRPEIVQKVVRMVNEKRLGGVLGHPLLDPAKYESHFPKPQVLWVAAKTREAGGKMIGRFKGYVLPSAEAREYLRLGLIDGVSWFGDVTMKPTQGGYDVVDFTPESIDFARKGRSGMPSRILALTGEQETRGGNSVEPKDIAALDEQELRTHAPLLVKEIERKATEPHETKVGEMQTQVAALQPEADIVKQVRDLLKLSEGENPVEKVQNLLAKIEELSSSDVKAYIKELISKKVKTDRGQALVARLIGEMHDEYDGPLTDDLKKKIEDDFEAKIEKDEDVKAVVGEMMTFTEGGASRDEKRGGSALGGKSRVGEQRGRENGGEGERKGRTGALTIRKRLL